jgi:hypothetical protein
LTFFSPGELRTLRVADADVFRLVLSKLSRASAARSALAMNSLCVVELDGRLSDAEDQAHTIAIIDRCAATLTELKGPVSRLWRDRSGRPLVLARCTRLEVLTCARDYAATWLGLSQLHTLREVDLNQVSTAAIAAALPRLHTLTAYGSFSGVDRVAGFFTDLLPRLRVFHFMGWWPEKAITSPVAPLPVLEELVWINHNTDVWIPLPTAFLGARPIVLRAPYELIAKSLPGRSGAPGEPASGFLARVCDLRLVADTSVSVYDVAELLRAAPRLRTFGCSFDLCGDMRWLTEPMRPFHPAFVGLIHPRLRYFHVHTRVSATGDDACVSRLRGTCFPQLRGLKLIEATFFVTPDATGRHQMVNE